jgi:hypothetical protein
VSSRRSPDWLSVALAGVALGLVGEFGDQLGSLCQVRPQTGWLQSVAGSPGAKAADLGW